jgi:hypothetical protein
MIPFHLPEVGKNLTEEEWDELRKKMKEASSFVGAAVRLGEVLEEEGFLCIRREFVPVVQKTLQDCQPRIISGYATVLWFTSKVSILPSPVLTSQCRVGIGSL